VRGAVRPSSVGVRGDASLRSDAMHAALSRSRSSRTPLRPPQVVHAFQNQMQTSLAVAALQREKARNVSMEVDVVAHVAHFARGGGARRHEFAWRRRISSLHEPFQGSHTLVVFRRVLHIAPGSDGCGVESQQALALVGGALGAWHRPSHGLSNAVKRRAQ
jgi:hypothetical protein